MATRNPREVMLLARPVRRSAEPVGRPGTGAPGWQITTRSRRLAVAIAAAVSGGTVQPHGKGNGRRGCRTRS